MMFFFVSCVENASQKSNKSENKAPVEKGAEINWIDGLEKGFEQAISQNKPLMVDFTAGWCSWCKKLDRDVFTDPELVKLSKQFVTVKVDTDKYPQDARLFKVQGLPTILFLTPKGKVINQVVGYNNSEYFIKIMSAIVKSK
jgi:thiol:disulfide interchange protein DsbD